MSAGGSQAGRSDAARNEILRGLRAGRVLNITRRDSHALPIVMAMQTDGLVTTELVQIDEQSSVLQVRIRDAWEGDGDAESGRSLAELDAIEAEHKP